MHRLDAIVPERIAPGAFRATLLHGHECRRLLALLEVSEAWKPSGAVGSAVLPGDLMTPEMLIYAEAVHRLVDADILETEHGVFGDRTWPAVACQEFRRGSHTSAREAEACLSGAPRALTVLLALAVDGTEPFPQGEGGIVLTSDTGRSLPLAVPAGTAVVVDGSWTLTAYGSRTDLLVEYVRVGAEGAVR
ncbi:hypothetical protein ACIBAG_31375 [Streptomyces sp. NPDC051243]|uniref:hypothetical protein n=1 Tax=Streptomyces sp. NPDC051243 TaxID=3365646 RepID=UPI0037B9F986